MYFLFQITVVGFIAKYTWHRGDCFSNGYKYSLWPALSL